MVLALILQKNVNNNLFWLMYIVSTVMATSLTTCLMLWLESSKNRSWSIAYTLKLRDPMSQKNSKRKMALWSYWRQVHWLHSELEAVDYHRNKENGSDLELVSYYVCTLIQERYRSYIIPTYLVFEWSFVSTLMSEQTTLVTVTHPFSEG